MESKPLKDYLIIKKIGKGGFGEVYKAQRRSDDKIIALKVIHVPNEKLHLIEKTIEEIDTLKTLSVPTCNPFVICYYNSYYNPSVRQFLVEMELVEGQEMQEYVDNLWDNKTSEEVYYYLLLIAKDLLNGLKYTHNKGIIHNDIKFENIMIDTKNVPRIIDYGLACNIIGTNDLGKYCTSNGGTVIYIAPEYLSRGVRLPSSDLWALGILLYMAATKFQYPFYNIDLNTNNTNIILDGISMYLPMKLNTSNQQLDNLVNGLLVKDPSKRLTVDQALAMLSTIQKPSDKSASKYPSKITFSPRKIESVKQLPKVLPRLDDLISAFSEDVQTDIDMEINIGTPEEAVDKFFRFHPHYKNLDSPDVRRELIRITKSKLTSVSTLPDKTDTDGGFLTPEKPKSTGVTPLKYEFLTPTQQTPGAVSKRLSKNILIDSILF